MKTLQRTLNNLGSNLVVDGVMGTQTVTEINNYENQIDLYNNFKSNRQKYYEEITENSVDNYLDKHPDASQQEIKDNTFEKFIDGWTNRVNEFKDKSQINNQDVNC